MSQSRSNLQSNSQQDLLVVPIHLDALHLKNGTSVAEAMVEFNRLPYFRGDRDVNPDTVNLSESIVSQPFQNRNLYLKPGMHLHWALPDALTKKSAEGEFPMVPNRWLVTRSKGGNSKSWVVESDYLYPATDRLQEDSITYPYRDNSQLPPFRYLGRKLTLEDWIKIPSGNSSDQYLKRLTAVGYGEPTFAAFYPNCRSVFGFHDPDFTDPATLSALTYDVIGWYSQEPDHLSEFFSSFVNSFKKDSQKDPTLEDWIDAIERELKWKIGTSSSPPNDKQPESAEQRKARIEALQQALNWTKALASDSPMPQMVCCSRLTFKPQDYTGQPPLETVTIKLAVANTGTEALSAYLAETINSSQKAIAEEQLEALQLAETLENQQLDTGFKFEELRHEAGFNGVAGGSLWRIQLNTSKSQANAETTSAQTTLNLPDKLASQLNTLNQAQQNYAAAWATIISRRKQLFSDWYKYMVSTYPPEGNWNQYPDIDDVKHYVERQGMQPLDQALNQIGTFKLLQDDSGELSSASGEAEASQAADLANKINALISQIAAHNTNVTQEYNSLTEEKRASKPAPPTYSLTRASSPRYWEPKEPVVLIVGDDAVKASQRHGEDGGSDPDGLLNCHLLTLPEEINDIKIGKIRDKQFVPVISEQISNKLDELQTANPTQIGFKTWDKQPWNPILLEWLVELFPVVESSNKENETGYNYQDDFITRNYSLGINAVDLSPPPSESLRHETLDPIKIDTEPNIYSGSSILTPYANSLLQKRIEEFLRRHGTLEKFYQEKEIPLEQQKIELLPQQIDAVQQWYSNQDFNDPIYTAIRAYQRLQPLNCLSQALGGFNQALLMHKQTLQLAIEDPIGFENYQTFTEQVHTAVETEIKSAPQPLDDFNPIRSGEMRIIDLQLIDTFGQVRNLEWNESVIKPEGLKASASNRIALPPRFVQPCRINFRWLSASAEAHLETNDHPATSPICGWILPNNLSNSLMIYDCDGQALGSINLNAEWDYAPGSTRIKVEEISNPHLRKVVSTVKSLGTDFLNNFNICLNNALNNIDPENFAQHQSLALLMGRPIAVVRASINFELQGLPAINQDWNVFRREMDRHAPLEDRDTDNFVGVNLPIRIGEYRQLNDGVIGYWQERGDGTTYEYENDIFYAPQSDLNESDKIETLYVDSAINPGVAEGAINIIQSIQSPAQTLTMLVDPRGVFHATSGVLPSKAITIPPEQYAKALANIRATFLTTPILTEQTQPKRLKLPLPTAPDYDWIWLEKQGREQWTELLTFPVIEKSVFTQAYSQNLSEGDRVWAELVRQSWLLEPSDRKAKIRSKDKRPKLVAPLENLDEAIEKLFDLYAVSIQPVSSRAVFGMAQEIREGWLVLSEPQKPLQ